MWKELTRKILLLWLIAFGTIAVSALIAAIFKPHVNFEYLLRPNIWKPLLKIYLIVGFGLTVIAVCVTLRAYRKSRK